MSDGEVQLDRLFVVLLEELSSLSIGSPVTRAAVSRLAERAKKRARYVRPHLEIEAREKFMNVNNVVGSHKLSIDPIVLSNAQHFIRYSLERFTKSRYPDSIQNPLEVDYLHDHWRFGPGASNGVKGTHTAEKIVQSMTTTVLCRPSVLRLRRTNPYFQCNDARNGDLGVTVVDGSRLAFVPKNEDTVRTIAIEPSGNMCLQLAAGHYLEDTLRYVGLDIRNQQPKNKALAQHGSKTGGIATIDLKSASDMISIDLVRALMPRDWYELLYRLRSPLAEVPGYGVVKLSMISTMGNGFTFPLMTMLLTALIYGLRCKTPGNPTLRIDWSSTAVYGDDIIVPVDEYAPLVEVLESAGFVVNLDKSYSEGPFRESCGGDYHDGEDITPFYVKKLTSESSIYVAINQVLEWSGRHCWLPKTLMHLTSLLRGKVLLVPEWKNPDQGILTAQCPRRYKFLQPVVIKHPLKTGVYDFMLAVGGYVSESGSDLFFVPRPRGQKYRVRPSRLPRGYLDGWDPCKRTQLHSASIATLVAVALAE